jgi:TonB family protein
MVSITPVGSSDRVTVPSVRWILIEHSNPPIPELPLSDGLADEAVSAVATLPRGRVTPPHPADVQVIDTGKFARRAGLPLGSGITVVLRVEVRADGAVGRVAVDVSGGNPRIDAAAIEYVRAMRWIGGRVDDEPEALWVRWGVSLRSHPASNISST